MGACGAFAVELDCMSDEDDDGTSAENDDS